MINHPIVAALVVKGQILVAALALIILLTVIRLVRKSSLRDAYALIWLMIGGGTLAVALIPAAFWDRVARMIGITSGGTTLLLVLGLFGALALIMQLSLSLTRIERILVRTVIEGAVESESRRDRSQ